MADNELTVVRADGATRTLRDRDISGIHAQMVDVAPWRPTVVSTGSYANAVTTGVVTPTVPSGATHCLVSVDGGDLRFVEDGTTPTSSNGIILKDGTIAELAVPGSVLSFARANTTPSVTVYLNVTWRRYV